MFSGGAEGADRLWLELAQISKTGIHACVCSFSGHTPSLPRNQTTSGPTSSLSSLHVWEIKQDELDTQMDTLTQASRYLGRRVSGSKYVTNLLLRNVSIVKFASAVYAVGHLNLSKRKSETNVGVEGGTAWVIISFSSLSFFLSLSLSPFFLALLFFFVSLPNVYFSRDVKCSSRCFRPQKGV